MKNTKTKSRKYEHEKDFLPIRDFLANTYRAFERPLNWRIERWNYARYFVAPYLGVYDHDAAPTVEESLQAIQVWEDAIRVWENRAGEIVGVLNIEHPAAWHPGFGEAFFQRHPRYLHLLTDMLEYAEAHLVNPRDMQLHTYVYEHDEQLQSLLQARGYQKDTQDVGWDSELIVRESLPAPKPPEGFVIQSMTDENDIEARREIFGRGFNHPDPAEWPSRFTYEELQRAPDYRKDLDLYVVAPGGEHVACCIAWYDSVNRIGTLEPVSVHPDFRRRGLGRDVVLEGIRRTAALSARKIVVGSGQPFYERIGFKRQYVSYRWAKSF